MKQVRAVMHLAGEHGKTWCGVKLTGDNAVPGRYAKHVTCKRCLASLAAWEPTA